MIVVASTNGNVGIQVSLDVLKAGGTAVAAVEAGIRVVEANPKDRSVGFNGFPNILGELELDASIMNGRSLETGAVGAMRGYTYAITVARHVMEKLPHVFLVGEGAERFASEMGLTKEEEMVLAETMAFREQRLKRDMPEGVFESLPERTDLYEWVKLATDPKRTYGTVNFIAQDKYGDICTGVSTSGWAWKYPGRLGDSPIIGAGNYADNRHGAAACTGMGEMAIRGVTAYSVVFYMKMGLSVEEAGKRAMADLNDLGGRFISRMNIVALDKDGKPAGFTSQAGRTYIYQTAEMDSYIETERTYVNVPVRWDEEA